MVEIDEDVKKKLSAIIYASIGLYILGWVFYTLIVMPFKYQKYKTLRAKADPSLVLKPYAFYPVAYGGFIYSTVAFIYGIVVGWPAMTYGLALIFYSVPVRFTIIGIRREMEIIEGPIDDFVHENEQYMPIEFYARIFVAIGAILVTLIVIYQELDTIAKL